MSLGTPELIVIFVLVLLLFGPNRLPELARSVGKGLREFRKITGEVQNQIAQLAEDDPTPRTSRNTVSKQSAFGEDSVSRSDLPPLHAENPDATETSRSGSAEVR
jgi:sec-independent protein translocase protein TatA